ncbi:MAG: hypothetical protein H6719_21065 [Sandaracinaceae bacterium]|nr:hypothetical protein [Sandaracinaceae bacterium]
MALVRIVAALALWASAAGVAHAQLLSPGPLASDHSEIDGDSNCSRCHESGRRIAPSRCNQCHGDVGRTMSAGTGLHGRQYRGQSCGECHVEHRGRSGHLVRWPGGSQQRLDHAQTGWPLHGAHARPGCDDCHRQRNSRGHRTFLGASRQCASCHEDPHSGRFGRDCSSCHQDTRWSAVELTDFDHSRTRYALRGAHQRVDCAGCHHSPPRYRGIAFGQCSSCHQDPHAGRYGAECSSCHTETAWTDLGDMRAHHPGLRLSGGHQDAACGDCHDVGVDRAPSRGSACASCHRPVHEADLGRRCERCHGSIRWLGLPRGIGLRAHEQTPFPLIGEHVDTPCQDCHTRERPRDERYRGLAYDTCASCHQDAHGGEFAARDGGECRACHDERGFSPTLFGVAAHAGTGFALQGLHAAVACGGCHQGERPRLDWHLTNRACADCHQNPHGEQFAAEMRTGGCESCHNASGWDRPSIDHSSWTLDGAHALVACVACHSPSEEDRRTGQGASYRGVPRECAGCHEDEHAGQFRLSEPRRECTDCHDTASFAIAHFDHEATASYPLVGHHAQAECSACHAAAQLTGGAEVTRWRLGYRECRDCHRDPHAGGGSR